MRTLNKLFIFLVFSFLPFFAFSQVPLVTEDSPVENFVGESYCFQVNFKNDDATIGYQPYLRFVVPVGLDISMITFGPSAAAGGVILSQVFDASGIIEDPLIKKMLWGMKERL